MFDTVTAAAEKVTGAAIFSVRSSNTLGHLVPFGRMIGFFVAFEHFFHWGRVSGTGREFFVRSGLLVADETVYLGWIGKIECFGVLPAVTGMTGCATSLVALNVHSEIVDRQPAFAQLQVFFGGWIHPSPVNCLVKLRCRLGMTGEASLGHFRSGCEFLLQGFVLGVVSRDPKLFDLCRLLGHHATRCRVLGRFACSYRP